MPIEVTCRCGKIFRVLDTRAGQHVPCGVCGQPVLVPLGVPAAPPVFAVRLPPAPAPAAGGPTGRCPACAEAIPADADVCPFCRESLRDRPNPERVAALVRARVADLDDYLSQSGGVAQDETLIARGWVARTWVALAFSLCSVALIVGGAMASGPGDAAVPWVVCGILLGIPALISLLVSGTHDRATAHIHDARDAVQAYRRYFLAIRSRRTRRAFAALAPAARVVGPVPAVRFEKIPMRDGPWRIDDPASYREYWQGLLRGPSLNSRGCRLVAVRAAGVGPNGEALIDADVEFSNYPSLLVLLILVNLIVCAIVIAIVTKREKRTIRKRLVRRDSRWYVLDGELEGPGDQATGASLAQGGGHA